MPQAATALLSQHQDQASEASEGLADANTRLAEIQAKLDAMQEGKANADAEVCLKDRAAH